MAVNQILKLTPDEFIEQPVSFIEPVTGSLFGKGLHTLSGSGNITLVDGKRYRFNRFYLMSQFRKRLDKLPRDSLSGSIDNLLHS